MQYLLWRKVFGRDEIKVVSPIPVKSMLGEEEIMVYLLDLDVLASDQWERLVTTISEGLSIGAELVAQHIKANGMFPIRKEDVIITMDPQDLAQLVTP